MKEDKIMLTAIAPGANDPHYLILAEKAWKMWNKATEIADSLWDEFESYFMDKCMEMEENKGVEQDFSDEWEMANIEQIPDK